VRSAAAGSEAPYIAGGARVGPDGFFFKNRLEQIKQVYKVSWVEKKYFHT
jgi:hypothetical protein